MCERITPGNPVEPGYNRATWLRGAGTAVFVPENFEPHYRYPVVVWLEASAAEFEARTWFPLITARNALAISLQPPGTEPAAWGRSLNDVRRALAYVGESVAEVAEEIAVHPRRIFLAGRGDGAAMAAGILRADSERFAGGILVDPTGEAAAVSRHAQRSARRSRVLVASCRGKETHTPWSLHTHFDIETVSGLSKPQLAGAINHWLMEHVAAPAPQGRRGHCGAV